MGVVNISIQIPSKFRYRYESIPIQKHPQYVLGDQSVPSSICVLFPLVFAGNDDGTVVIRAPTYTTAAMGTDNEGGYCQPVIHVETSGATQHSTVNDWHGKIQLKDMIPQVVLLLLLKTIFIHLRIIY
uniref:Uncharacterized protein n=1 Tax=Amphimedon queenslandica TaxID=400682 RepID=A0A1X7SFV0_AMPQE